MLRLECSSNYPLLNSLNIPKEVINDRYSQLPFFFYDGKFRVPEEITAFMMLTLIKIAVENPTNEYIQSEASKISKSLVNLAIRHGIDKFVETACRNGDIKEEDIDRYIQLAIDCKMHEIYLMLLNYKNENFEFGFDESRFEL